MKLRLIPHLSILALLMLAGLLPTNAASTTIRTAYDAKTSTIPCGTMQQLHLSSRPWSTNRTVTVDFDASGGGTVWLYVPPNQVSALVPADNTTRHYTRSVTITDGSQNPVPVQVIGAANTQSCAGALVVDNVVVTGP